MTRVAVVGASGRLGSQVCRVVESLPDFEVVARLGSADSLNALVDADVVVDVTRHDVSHQVVREALRHGARVIVGTSGWDSGRIDALRAEISADDTVVIIPNFSLGSTISTHIAGIVAEHIPGVEIMEAHHINKVDSPSGTAIRTAEVISERRGAHTVLPDSDLSAQPARGQLVAGVPVHSLRLPGILAQQEVVFAGNGETVSITHTTLSRDSYDAGIAATLKYVADAAQPGVTVGLDRVLGISR